MTIDPSLLEQCVGCGLCLSSCPTFSVTRLEHHGPRGRIQGMRFVEDGTFDILDPDYVSSMETCVQCRACEDVCPSDVSFGALMEQARADIVTARGPQGRPRDLRGLAQRGLLLLVSRPTLLRTMTRLLSLAQLTRVDRLLPSALRVAIRVRPSDLPDEAPEGSDVVLFRGCVMDAWFGAVHEASVRVLEASDLRVDASRTDICCGALHLHAGELDTAKEFARRTIDAFADTEGPVVVNSAGCGAAMKEYGHLLGTPEAERFAERVRDLGEVVDPSRLRFAPATERTVTWQAPCHLRYVQGSDATARDVLAAIPGVTVVEGADQQLCCGAGGAYSLVQPEFSTALRDQKCAALRATDGEFVVSANPGCSLQLASGGLEVRHLAEVLAEALEER